MTDFHIGLSFDYVVDEMTKEGSDDGVGIVPAEKLETQEGVWVYKNLLFYFCNSPVDSWANGQALGPKNVTGGRWEVMEETRMNCWIPDSNSSGAGIDVEDCIRVWNGPARIQDERFAIGWFKGVCQPQQVFFDLNRHRNESVSKWFASNFLPRALKGKTAMR